MADINDLRYLTSADPAIERLIEYVLDNAIQARLYDLRGLGNSLVKAVEDAVVFASVKAESPANENIRPPLRLAHSSNELGTN